MSHVPLDLTPFYANSVANMILQSRHVLWCLTDHVHLDRSANKRRNMPTSAVLGSHHAVPQGLHHSKATELLTIAQDSESAVSSRANVELSAGHSLPTADDLLVFNVKKCTSRLCRIQDNRGIQIQALARRAGYKSEN